jgi:hypothetical protein
MNLSHCLYYFRHPAILTVISASHTSFDTYRPALTSRLSSLIISCLGNVGIGYSMGAGECNHISMDISLVPIALQWTSAYRSSLHLSGTSQPRYTVPMKPLFRHVVLGERSVGIDNGYDAIWRCVQCTGVILKGCSFQPWNLRRLVYLGSGHYHGSAWEDVQH